jgi:hypothetical protein
VVEDQAVVGRFERDRDVLLNEDDGTADPPSCGNADRVAAPFRRANEL